MDAIGCAEKISEAETELRNMAAKLISSGPAYDAAVVTCLLKQAETLLAVYHSLSTMSNDADYIDCPKETTADVSYPVVFVHDNQIYRISLSKKKDDDAREHRWWKSVDCEEAFSIMNSIYNYPKDKFRMSDIRKESGALEYRINVVLTALKEVGAIKPLNKQGYNTIQSGMPTEWLNEIKELPERTDLLTKE